MRSLNAPQEIYTTEAPTLILDLAVTETPTLILDSEPELEALKNLLDDPKTGILAKITAI